VASLDGEWALPDGAVWAQLQVLASVNAAANEIKRKRWMGFIEQ
jgi:hypothetical protein